MQVGKDSVTGKMCFLGFTPTCTVGGGGGGTASIAPFKQTGTVSLAVSSSSARQALANTDQTLMISNTGTSPVGVKLGGSSVAAALTDFTIPPGVMCPLDTTGATYVAAISVSGSFTLNMVQGTGGGGGCVISTDFTATTPVSLSPTVVTPTERGGTITAGGTAQNALTANASRKFWCIQNDPAASETLYVQPNATASATSGVAVEPGKQTCAPIGMVTTGVVSVFAATTGHRWFSTEFQ
jgi:hypothetical protein